MARLVQNAIRECADAAFKSGDHSTQTLEIRLRLANAWKPECADQFRQALQKRLDEEAMAMMLLLAA